MDFEENRGTDSKKIDTDSDPNPKTNPWSKFWNWYEDKILGSVILIAIIQFIQIPHMVWNADMMLEAGMISRIHPVIDWFLYGVDLIEIVSIINVGMIMFSLIKKRRREKSKPKKCIWCQMDEKYDIKIPDHCECESS